MCTVTDDLISTSDNKLVRSQDLSRMYKHLVYRLKRTSSESLSKPLTQKVRVLQIVQKKDDYSI